MAFDKRPQTQYFGPITPSHICMLLLLSLIWSSSFVATNIGVKTIPPITLTTLRLITAVLILVFITTFTGVVWGISRKIISYCFWGGLFGCSLPFFLIGWGQTQIDSGLAAVLMSIMPLFTLLLSHFFTKGDQLTIQKLVGITLGFMGIIVLVGTEALTDLGQDTVPQLATAAAAACYAINIIIMRNMPQTSILSRSILILSFATLQLIPFAIVIDQPWSLNFNHTNIGAILYLGIFPTAIASLIFFRLLSVREPTFVAYLNYMIPIFGVGWGAAILNEELTVRAFVSLGLILIGMLIANLKLTSGISKF